MRTGETVVTEVPIPQPRPGTALVETAVSLVSAGTERMVVEFAEKSLIGKARSRPDLVRQVLDKARREGLLTTLESALNRLDQPMTLGYSSAGRVAAVGKGLQGYRVGDRVACAGGGAAVHAEYAIVPRNLMTPIPENVDYESAAFATLGAIALHGFRLAQTQVGERVAVIGLGLLGLLMVEIAQAAGCPVVGIDLDPARVELARRLGAEAVLRPEAEAAAQAYSRGRGVDAVLICADTPSNDPVELAGKIARDRAKVVAVGAVGMHVPRKIYYEKELDFLISRSYGPGRYDPGYEERGQDYPLGYVRWTEGRNLEAVLDLISGGRMDVHPLISHRFPIEQAPQAYELITGKKQEPFLGVLLTYSPGAGLPETGFKEARPENGQVFQPARLEQIGVGVLGAGNYASAVFLPVIQQTGEARRIGIATASGVSAQHAARKFGFNYASSREEEVLDDPAVNLVVLLTRHNQHARQILACLERGKAVFCEKPLAIYPEELEQIRLALVSPAAPLLAVGFNRRFSPFAGRLADFLARRTEPLAAHYRVNAGYLPPNHWLHDPEVGGGRIIGEGCHFIDFLTFLVGAPPVRVFAQALPDLGRYQEDNVILTLNFADGSLGTLSYLANGDKTFPKERLEVFCGGQVAVLDDFRSLELISGGQSRTYRSRLKQDKGHQAGWKEFLRALRAGGSPPIPYEHLIGVTQTTFAAVQSLREKRVIDLAEYQARIPDEETGNHP